MQPSKIILLLLLAVGLFACGTTKQEKDPDKDPETTSSMDFSKATQISYRFRDSSVPPPYHRSYHIDVTPASAHYEMYDYDSVLNSNDVAVTPEGWERLVQLANDLQEAGEFVAEGATGTTGNTIQIFEGEKKVYELYWDSLSRDKIKDASIKVMVEVKKMGRSDENAVPEGE